MPIERPPSFPLYVNDFACDGLVEAMTTEEVGAYILLLCKAWLETPPASIPNDDRVLSRWSRVSVEKWATIKQSVLSPFKIRADGRFYQKRLEIVYNSLMERRKERSISGMKGAMSKWKNGSANGSANGSRMAKEIEIEIRNSTGKGGGGGKGFVAPTRSEIDQLFAKAGGPTTEAEKFWNFYMSKGWKVGKNRMQSVPHAVGGWMARWREEKGSVKKTDDPNPFKL